MKMLRMLSRTVSLLRQHQQHHQNFQQKVSLLPQSTLQCFPFSSSLSPQPNQVDTSKSHCEQGSIAADLAKAYAKPHILDVKDEPFYNMISRYLLTGYDRFRERFEQSAFSHCDDDLDLVKVVAEKEEMQKVNDKIYLFEGKVFVILFEIEDLMKRAKTKQKAENSQKFSIQNFVKAHLEVAYNLGQAYSVVKENLSKIYASKDPKAVSLSKTLLELIETTDKQLAQVFKKLGVETFDPTNEQFDPTKHNAVLQVPDPEKAPGVVAVCIKPGYSLRGRIIQPAEVGVTVAMESTEANQSTNT